MLAALTVVAALTTVACASWSWFETVPPTLRHMYEHFEQITSVQTAVIEGDLERAHRTAQEIVDHDDAPGLPPGSEGYVQEMRMRAGEVAGARTLGEAAAATAQLGSTCGSCHSAYGVGPRFAVGSTPPEATEIGSEMVRHIWAADRMWDGIIGPSEDAWKRGASSLRGATITLDTMGNRAGDSAEVTGLARKIHDLADRAEGVTSSSERTSLYGEFLGTCSACHQRTRGGL